MGKAWCFESAIYSHVLQDLHLQTDYGMCDADSLHLYRYTSERAVRSCMVASNGGSFERIKVTVSLAASDVFITKLRPINHQLMAIFVHLI